MNKKPYSFCVLRYAHDPTAGECLNIGVLIVSEMAAFLDIRLDFHYERLSSAFSGFEGERFKQVLRHMQSAVEQERDAMFEPKIYSSVADRSPLTADRIAARVWSDAGLSFRASEAMAGLAEDLPSTLTKLFDRFVTSQYERQQGDHVSDDQVWSAVRPKLDPAVTRVLRPKTFETSDFSLEFPHAFENERWHLIQPVSMDYAHTARIQEKAARWLGNTAALEDDPQARESKLYLIVHPPTLEQQKSAYHKAVNLLNKISIEHEIYEDDDVGSLSKELVSHLHDAT
jgi:Protein of unknown function (DUF3037)